MTMERSRLMQAKTLAMRRQDYVELAEIESKLKELPAQVVREEEETLSGKLAKVNERNRRANLEVVRKAEFEAERKRKERKLAASGLSGSATPDPSGKLRVIPKPLDSASRLVALLSSFAHLRHFTCHSLSAVPRIRRCMDRSGTPNLSAVGTPILQAQSIAMTRPISPLPSSALSAEQSSPRKSLEASLKDIEIDLGDF